MVSLRILLFAGSFLVAGVSSKPILSPDFWGFFAHKRINYLAVLTLPPEMMIFYKPHIEFVSNHAVDADMRRYASQFEAPRHFIDLDNYGPPFDKLPQGWREAVLMYTQCSLVTDSGDTLQFGSSTLPIQDSTRLRYNQFFFSQIYPKIHSGDVEIPIDSVKNFMEACGWKLKIRKAFFADRLTEHGIIPWHLQKMQKLLTEAFRKKEVEKILRLSADIGHYIGDAHVPLHTCSNYNGQKTGQQGIHGFWESRIPELFADAGYDYFVGKPEYIEHTAPYFWNIVFQSHTMVDSVLAFERALRLKTPPDLQNCPDLRNGILVLAPCRAFSAQYQEDLQNMIERRMRGAIHALSSCWYTAWVDAGQPDLSGLESPIADNAEDAGLLNKFISGKILGRHEDH